ncbi:MAG: C25 family cysteine peptidase, partial [Candidatus Eisenbacteria bacterium]
MNLRVRWGAVLVGLAGAGLCSVLAVVGAFAAPLGGRDLQLAPATPGAVRFTVRTPEPQLLRVDAEQRADRLELEGYDAQGTPGTPGTWTRTVLVAVPPLGDVRLSSATSDLQVLDDVLLAPQPGLSPAGEVRAVERDLAVYGRPGSASPAGARLLEVSWLRNQRVARIELSPVAYEPSARRLNIATRIDVELAVTHVGTLAPLAEPNDPFERVYEMSVLNYEQGRTWRRPVTDVLRKAALRSGIPIATIATATAAIETTSVFARRTWVRMSIQKTGFYAINFSRLRNTSVFSGTPARLDSLRLFTWPGRTQLPEDSYCDSCDYREVALGLVRDVGPADPATPEIDGPADTLFSSNNDAVYFFAQAANGWESDMDSALPDTNWVNHQYERNNYYYLTVADAEHPFFTPRRRIGFDATDTRDVSPGGSETVVATVPGRAHFEEDNEYSPDAAPTGATVPWEKWFWFSITSGKNFSPKFDLPDLDETQPARFRLRQWGLSRNSLFFCPYTDHVLDVSINSVSFPRRVWNGITGNEGGPQTFELTGTFLQPRDNQIVLDIPTLPANSNCAGRVDRSALAYFEVYYERKLIPVDDAIEFRTRPGAGRLRYDIGPFVKLPSTYVFDITEPTRPVLLTGLVPGGTDGAHTLSFTDTNTVSHRYIVVPDSIINVASALLPASALTDVPAPTNANLKNLRSPENAADYLVIHYDGFAEAADSLVTWRRQHLPLISTPAPHEAFAVPVSAIYNQFSGGRTDIGAMRNFLRAVYNWSRRPLYVTFLGDASFDFKDITGRAGAGQPGCLLPTYENNFDLQPLINRQYATDDWIVNVDDPVVVLPDYLSGRIPANDAAGALAVVTSKILGYERSAPLGEYR